jgi:hypothetical protein
MYRIDLLFNFFKVKGGDISILLCSETLPKGHLMYLEEILKSREGKYFISISMNQSIKARQSYFNKINKYQSKTDRNNT